MVEMGCGSLPAVVGERLVGFRHLVRILSLFHGSTTPVGCIHQFAGQLGPEPFLTATACISR
jgi:hypothetical protein